MKVIIFIIVILFNSAVALAVPHNLYAKISINHDPAMKVTLTHGYKALFCQIEDITIQTPGPLGIEKGNSVAGISTINNALYKNLMQNAPCISDSPIKEIIVGDTLIDYFKGYQGDETFFIIDNKMYRTGSAFFNYYRDSNYQTDATLGGKMKRTYGENAIEGIEYTGSEYFFEAEYLSSSSDSARLDNTKYIKHYSETGIDDGTIITFQGKSYRRTEIIKELSNEILLEYEVPDLSPTPDPTADWKSISSSLIGISIMHPLNWISEEKDEAVYDDYIQLSDKSSGRMITIYRNSIGGTTVKGYKNIATTIDGIKAEKIFYTDSSDPPSRVLMFINLEKNSENYFIPISWNIEDLEAEVAIDQILSTFKFTE